MFSADIELKNVDKLLTALKPELIRRASQRTIKRVASAGKTEISKQVRVIFNIKKQDVDRKISVGLSGLNASPPQAVLSIVGEPISLTYFKPRTLSVSRFQKLDKEITNYIRLRRTVRIRKSRYGSSGVQVEIIKRKVTVLRSAFMAKGKGGTLLVFRRQGKKRFPIAAQKIITLQSIVKQPKNMKAIDAKITQQLRKEWPAQLAQAKREAGL